MICPPFVGPIHMHLGIQSTLRSPVHSHGPGYAKYPLSIPKGDCETVLSVEGQEAFGSLFSPSIYLAAVDANMKHSMYT